MMLRLLGWLLGALAALVGAALLVLLLTGGSALRGPIEALASGLLGRKVEIGALHVSPGCTTRIAVSDLRVANADWGKADSLLTLGAGEIAIRVPPLLRGEREIPELVLQEPRVALEKNQEGKSNWDILPDRKDEREKQPVELPGHIRIEGGRFSYRDAEDQMQLEGEIASLTGDGAGRDPLTLTAAGTLEGKPLSFAAKGGPARRLQTVEGPYALQLDLDYGETSLVADGSLTDPSTLDDFTFDMTLEGPTLKEMFPLFGVPLPDTPPYRVSGKLRFADQVWQLDGFQGRVGDSDLSGSLTLDQGGDTSHLKGDLASPSLDFDDLAGLIGGTPDPEETASPEQKKEAEKGGVFPDTPVSGERLHAMNMDISFQGERVRARTLPLEKMKFHLQVRDGRAEVKPLSFAFEQGGQVSGEVALNAREDVPSADADLTVQNLDLKPLFKDTRFVQEMGGRFFGHIYLLGVGGSLDAMMASARGDAWVAMRDGTISGLMVEMVGVDITEALALSIGGDARVGIRCGRADLDIKDGVATLKRFLLDTTDSLLVATGSANLGKETLDLTVEARAKDFSLIDASAPVHITGSMLKPETEVGKIEGFPLFEMGEQEDLDCESLLGEAGAGARDAGGRNANGG